MKFSWHDGGRALAGYSGSAGDCVVRAIAIATGLPYKDVYDAMFDLQCESPRSGVQPAVSRPFLHDLGWTEHEVQDAPRLRDAAVCGGAVLYGLRPDHRDGSSHLACVVDGEIFDTWDCSSRRIVARYEPPPGTGEPGMVVAPARTTTGYPVQTDKIRKRLDRLRATAENSASTDSERQAAERIMQSIMAEHEIVDLTPADIKAYGAFRVDLGSRRIYRWQSDLSWVVAQTCEVLRYRDCNGGYVFYGIVDDAEHAASVYNEMLVTIMSLATRKCGGYSRGKGASYAEGFVKSLEDDYRQRHAAPDGEAAEPESEHSERALIVHQKSEEADRWLLEECDIKLRNLRRYSARLTRSELAFAMGQRDGKGQLFGEARRARLGVQNG